MSNQIFQVIESKGLKANCLGQGYDGANTISAAYSGAQHLIKDKRPNALYVHCAAQNLNLVLNDSMSGVKETSAFFT